MLQVNVARLHDDNRESLSLAWLAGREGGTAVRREAAQAASLIGHLNLTHPNSIQVIGAYEAGTGTSFELVDTAQKARQAELDLTVKEFDVVRARLAALLANANCKY